MLPLFFISRKRTALTGASDVPREKAETLSLNPP